MSDTVAKLPAIPDVPGDVAPTLRQWMAAIATTLKLYTGRLPNQDKDDRLVTFRDLGGSDAAKKISASAGLASVVSATVTNAVQEAYNDQPDMTAPPAVTGVSATATQTGIMVAYDQPAYNKSGTSVSYHARTELLMAEANANGSSPGVSQAKITSQTAGAVMYVPVGNGRDVYLWLRNVSKADVKGPLYGGASGIRVQTPVQIKALLDVLNGAEFDGLTVKQNGFRICSPDGTKQVTPFAVLTQDTEMGGVMVPAGVYMDAAYIINLEAMAARFGEAAIDSAAIGDLTAFKARFTSLEAYSANLGNVEIGTDGALRTKDVTMGSGNGIFAGWDGEAYSLRVGKAGGVGLVWDGRTGTLNVVMPDGSNLISAGGSGNSVKLSPTIDNKYSGVKTVADVTAITADPGSDCPLGDAYWAVYDQKTGRMAAWDKTLGKYTFAPNEGDVDRKITAATSGLPTLDQIDDLNTAIVAEAQARSAAISEEANARKTALLQEQLTREAAITETRNLQQSADQSLAAEIAQVAAGTGEQFDSFKIWNFEADLEQWTGSLNGTPSAASIVDGWLRPPAGFDPFVVSPTGLGVNPTRYRFVKARIRKAGNPTWAGVLSWYGTANSGQMQIAEPIWDASGKGVVSCDDVPWLSAATIDQIRLDFSTDSSATDYIEIDWIAIGRPTPGAGVAALESVRQAMIAGDAASALKSDTLAAQLRGSYEGTDSGQLTQGLLYDVRKTAVDLTGAEAAKREALAATVADKADASAVQALTTRVSTAEGHISSQAQAITDLQASTTGGGNLLPNAGFEADATGWALGWKESASDPDAQLARDGYGTAWTPPGWHSLALYRSTPVPAGVQDVAGPRMACTPLQRYCISGWAASHRCASTYVLAFTDASGNYCGELDAQQVCKDTTPAPGLAGYQRVFAFGLAPAGAVYMSVLLRQYGKVNYASTQQEAFSFFCRPMVEEATAAQTQPSPWSPGSAGLASAIKSVESASIAADAALSQRIDTVSATASGAQSTANSAVTAAQTAQATANGKASASSVEQISARLNEGGDIQSAIVQVKATADATAGHVSGAYGFTLDVNGKVTGAKSFNDGSTSSFQISADKIVLGDVTNICHNDGNLLTLDGWSADATVAAFSLAPWGFPSVGNICFFSRDAFYGSSFTVTPGEQYWCEFDSVPTGGGASVYAAALGLYIIDGSGAAVTWKAGAIRPVGQTGGYHASGYLTIPASDGALRAQVWVQQDGPGGTHYTENGQSHHITNVVVRRRMTTDLIVNGAITAEKVSAEYTATTILQAKQAVVDYLAVKSLSAVCANIGNLTTTGWITATGDAVNSYGGVRSATDKWWADNKTGFIFAYKQDGAESFFEFVAKNSYQKLSSWGDNVLHFADASGAEMLHVDSAAGVMRMKGRIEATSGAIGGLVIDSDGLRSSNYAPGAAGFAINKSGAAEFDRTSVRNPNVVASGTQAIAPGWVGSLAGTRSYLDDEGTLQSEACDIPSFEGVIDTGVSYPVGWNAAPSDIYGCGLTISGGLSDAGGCNGYMQMHVEVGCGLILGTTPQAIQHRVYIRYKWTWDGAGGKIQPQQLAWKLVRL